MKIQQVNFTVPQKQISKLKSANLSRATSDVISFSGKKEDKDLLEAYKINPSEIKVVSKTCNTNLKPQEKKELITKVLEAHEQSLKHRKLVQFHEPGVFSGFYSGINMKLSNGQWSKVTNIESSVDDTFCGERGGLFASWNNTLAKLNLGDLKTKPDVDKAWKGLSVDTLAMSTSGSSASPIDPCSECLAWMNKDRFFKADTKIVTLEPDDKTKKPVLKIRTISELLPHRAERSSVADKNPIRAMDVSFSTRAQDVLKDSKISDEKIKNLIEKAKTSHDINGFTGLSGKNVGVAVLMNNNKIVTGKKFDWTRRWNTPAELNAVVKAFDKFGDDKDLKVKTVAYYGEKKVPDIKALGMISQERGSKNTLIATIQNDKIKVRTILDYMPFLYISTKRTK